MSSEETAAADLNAHLNEILGITDADIRAYLDAPRECGCGRINDDPLEERPCSQGCCVELFCPCGTATGDGWGPAGCPCQDSERLSVPGSSGEVQG